MNKKLITLAVAAAMTAPAAALAEATLYGKLHVSIDYFDIDSYGTTEAKSDFKGWTLNKGKVGKGSSRANRVGVKGSEDLGGGLKAIYQVEFGVPLANEADYDIDNGDVGGVSMRNSFVGLAGNFGTFLVGRHDTPLKISTGKLDMFSDTMADYNGTIGFQDVRADNAIAYISPSWSGFQFAGATVPGAASTVGGDQYNESKSISEGWSLAAIYSNGPFYGSVAFERLSDNLLYTTDDGEPKDNFDKWRAGLGLLDWNGFSLTGVYEKQKGGAGDVDNDLWQVQAGYAFGNNMIKAMYGGASRDGDRFITTGDSTVAFNFGNLTKDREAWAVGLDHNFSKRTKAYVLYTDVNEDRTDEPDWHGVSVGMIHKF